MKQNKSNLTVEKIVSYVLDPHETCLLCCLTFFLYYDSFLRKEVKFVLSFVCHIDLTTSAVDLQMVNVIKIRSIIL
jgi:hypothetical protein